MTDDFLTKRSKGFTVNTYHDAPLLIKKDYYRDLNNRELRRQAIWAIRHPNKKMPNAFEEFLMAYPDWKPWTILLPKDKEEKE